MKALTKEHLIELINTNYKDGQVIYQSDIERQFKRVGDDYFMERGVGMVLVKKAPVNWSDEMK